MGKPPGWVYFVRASESGHIKIGFTAGDPMVRMGALQTGNHEELQLIVAIRAPQTKERELHQRFAALNTKGEWFKSDPSLLGFIEALRWASDFDRYDAPAESAACPYGLCEEQVRVVVGYMQARDAYDAGQSAHERFAGRHKLDGDELRSLLDARGNIARMIQRADGPSESPDADGVTMFGSPTLSMALARVDEALARHGYAVTDERLAEDACDGVAPWECEVADAAFASELDDMDWAPTPAEEWN